MNDSTNSPENDNPNIFDFTGIETSADIIARTDSGNKHLYHTYLATMSGDIKVPSKPLKPRKTKTRFRSQATPTYVYIFYSETTELYKIGHSAKPKARLTEVKDNGQHANPFFEVTLMAYFLTDDGDKFENALHRQFWDKYNHKEWFRLSRLDVIDLVTSLLDGTHPSGWKAPEIDGMEPFAVFIDLETGQEK